MKNGFSDDLIELSFTSGLHLLVIGVCDYSNSTFHVITCSLVDEQELNHRERSASMSRSTGNLSGIKDISHVSFCDSSRLGSSFLIFFYEYLNILNIKLCFFFELSNNYVYYFQ